MKRITKEMLHGLLQEYARNNEIVRDLGQQKALDRCHEIWNYIWEVIEEGNK